MNYAAMIDHTLLKPEATKEQGRTICEEAVKYGIVDKVIASRREVSE